MKHNPWNVHVSGVFSWTIVFRFKPTNKKFPFIELTSFKSFDSEDPSFYFGSMPPFVHKPVLQKRLWKYQCPMLRLSKKSSRPPIRFRLYCIYTLLMYTNTARSTEAKQQLCSEALTSKVGLLQNFRAYKKWTTLSSNFWAINSRLWVITAYTRVFQRVRKMFGFLIIRKIFWLCSTYCVKRL